MNCSNCKETKLVMSERKGIEIDYCPDCRGIWLDRGELDKIIEKSQLDATPAQAAPQAQSVPQYPNHSNQYQKTYNRKKSFLEELFD